MSGGYPEEVIVIPEDPAIRDVVNGFLGEIDHQRLHVEPPSGGWSKAFDKLMEIGARQGRSIVVVIDEDVDPNRASKMPEGDHANVYVLTIRPKVESLRTELRKQGLIKPNSLEEIGRVLAKDCREGTRYAWACKALAGNSERLAQMEEELKPILFRSI